MPSTGSMRNRKRQSRLQFYPLPSSSPVKDNYSTAVQSRLANIRHDGTQYPSTPHQERNRASRELPPTPEPSSQIIENEATAASDCHRIPSPTSSHDPLITNENLNPHESLSDSADDDIILPSAKRRKTAEDTITVAEGEVTTPSRRSKRLSSRSSPPAQPSSAHSGRKSLTVLSDIASPETSEDEDVVLRSKATSKRKLSQRDDDFIDEDDFQTNESGKNSTKKTPRGKSRAEFDDFLADEDEEEYLSSDGPIMYKSKSQSSSRRKRSRSKREQQELEDDLEDLQDSEQEQSARKSRTRGGPVRTKHDLAKEHLAILRRRRAGVKPSRVVDSDDENDSTDEGVDIDLIGQPMNDPTDDDSVHTPIDIETSYNNLNDEDGDDFIVEDAEEESGQPFAGMPLEFTPFASSKPRELFPIVIEWFVKNKIAPAFSRNDELFNLAFKRVGDQVQAQAGSLLISAAWNATFKYSMLARPNIKITALPGDDEDNIRTCDACNQPNRPARFDFVLSGQAYSHQTLEPIENSDNEDVGDASCDEDGHPLASERRHFYLGSHCAAKAQMGHKLTHWKYHLNEVLLAHLEEQGVLSSEAVLAREKLNKKKREKEAEAVVDSLRETGMIAQFWSDFQDDLEDARVGMEDYEKRGGRSRGLIGTIRSVGANRRIREWRDDKYTETQQNESDASDDF